MIEFIKNEQFEKVTSLIAELLIKYRKEIMELEIQEVENINAPIKYTIKEASAIMGVTPRFLQLALQQNKFNFGTAVEGERWVYYINAEKLLNYMKGK